MPECSKCKATVSISTGMCPECGSPLTTIGLGGTVPTSDEDAVHALLLHAHLLKIRGDSDAAIAECIKALRINPDSIEAHSFLGDIYRSQGKIDEATHWYKLALDISPNNSANQSKLEQLSNGDLNSDPPDDDEAPGPFTVKRNQLIAVLTGAAIVLLIIILLTVPRHRTNTQTNTEADHYSQNPAEVYAPTVVPKLDARVEEVPVTTLSTGREAAMLNELSVSPTLTSGNLKVVTVVMDPRYSSAVITVVVPYTEGDDMAHVLVQGSLIASREVFQRDSSLTHVTMRALSTLPSSNETHPDLFFVGDVMKEKAFNLNSDTATYAEKISAFDNVWWHRYLK